MEKQLDQSIREQNYVVSNQIRLCRHCPSSRTFFGLLRSGPELGTVPPQSLGQYFFNYLYLHQCHPLDPIIYSFHLEHPAFSSVSSPLRASAHSRDQEHAHDPEGHRSELSEPHQCLLSPSSNFVSLLASRIACFALLLSASKLYEEKIKHEHSRKHVRKTMTTTISKSTSRGEFLHEPGYSEPQAPIKSFKKLTLVKRPLPRYKETLPQQRE